MHQVPPVRVGVVGIGVMGGHHTRVASTVSGGQLVGVLDMDRARAASVAAQYNAVAFPTLEALCEAVDAVIVASPTSTHAEVATACLQAGKHVLLEKPIAVSVAEAEALVAVSQQTDRVLMLGHVERFNPATTVLLSLLQGQELFALELHRLNNVPGRDRTADVIFDLMVHDLDLVLAFAQSRVTSIEASGSRHTDGLIDHAVALLHFENGVTATLHASWVGQERVRRARVLARGAQLTADFATREVSIARQGTASIATADGRTYPATVFEQLPVPSHDALTKEQEHFLHAIRTGTPPAIDAATGLEVLRLVRAVQDAIEAKVAAYV